jgi:hypothetical protein
MLTFAATVLLTFLVVLAALYGFWKLGPPVYWLERRNVIALLDMVMAGEASESDWHVFTGVPIRHNPELEAIQRRCLEIAEREYVGGRGYLFTEAGIEEIRELLEDIRRREEAGNSG